MEQWEFDALQNKIHDHSIKLKDFIEWFKKLQPHLCIMRVEMTEDQSERLHQALDNLDDLLPPEDDQPFVEYLIEVLTGKADSLKKEETMGRPKKNKALEVPKPPVEIPADVTAQITRWREVSEQLTAIKAEEHALRTALVAANFDPNKLEGTATIEIGWGWKLKATKKINYTVTDKQSIINLCQALASLDPALPIGLVDWKPDLSIKVYRSVLAAAGENGMIKPLLAAAIQAKPGMPELEMIAPEAQPTPEGGPTFTDGSNIEY